MPEHTVVLEVEDGKEAFLIEVLKQLTQVKSADMAGDGKLIVAVTAEESQDIQMMDDVLNNLVYVK